MPRYAAIDIGSNSIRLLVAEVNDRGRTRELVSDRQVVRLGTGVFRDGHLSEPVVDLSLKVLQRMADEFHEWRVDGVRAVATSAVRDAQDRQHFLTEAQRILGVPIEVVSGFEEARLVQLGVTARWPQPDKRLLIVDVGGGSAQLILSDGTTFVDAFSKPLGAVRLTEAFLANDPPTAADLTALQQHIRTELREPIGAVHGFRPQRLVATSSTAAAIVCAVNEVKRSRRDEADGLTASSKEVVDLLRRLADRDTAARSKLTGIGPRRAEIIVAGVAVLWQVLDGADLPRLTYSSAGVRDGIIAELAAGAVAGDPRTTSAR